MPKWLTVAAVPQLWFDSPQDFRRKYLWARDTQQLGGVGLWLADGSGFDAAVARAIWAAVPTLTGS